MLRRQVDYRGTGRPGSARWWSDRADAPPLYCAPAYGVAHAARSNARDRGPKHGHFDKPPMVVAGKRQMSAQHGPAEAAVVADRRPRTKPALAAMIDERQCRSVLAARAARRRPGVMECPRSAIRIAGSMNVSACETGVRALLRGKLRCGITPFGSRHDLSATRCPLSGSCSWPAASTKRAPIDLAGLVPGVLGGHACRHGFDDLRM